MGDGKPPGHAGEIASGERFGFGENSGGRLGSAA
jgi:hypothetical protein